MAREARSVASVLEGMAVLEVVGDEALDQSQPTSKSTSLAHNISF